jgi:peptidoglycan/xylan/chitin deacetylase (PgdA/CDA1 family)
MGIRIGQVKNRYINMKKLTVIMYHYVRELKCSRFPEIRGLDFKFFVEQINYLKKNYQFVTAEQVSSHLDGQYTLPEKPVLLTFDDGYIDHYTFVFPFLDSMGIQGSFYIPVKAVSENTVLDVNKIHFILASTPDKTSLVSSIKRILDRFRNDNDIEPFESLVKKFAKPSRHDTAVVMLIKNLLQYVLPVQIRSLIVDELFVQTVRMDEASFSRELYMSTEQVKTMHRHGMHIGCHGSDHFWWDKLDKSALEYEIDKSLEFLIKVGVSENFWTACYPYGSYSELSMKVLDSRKCKYGLTSDVRVADFRLDNRLILPRLDTLDIPMDRDARLNPFYY